MTCWCPERSSTSRTASPCWKTSWPRRSRPRKSPDLQAADSARLASTISEDQQQLKELRQQLTTLRKENKHTPPIPVEMTFNVYRTTKGEIGEPVYASVKVINPRPGIRPDTEIIPDP